MTLQTVPRYQTSRPTERADRAVVLGAGVGGLLSARVLSDHFERVTVVERDPLPTDPTPRPSVPQGRHPHVLLVAGRETLADLFPGFGTELVRAGGVVTDFNSDVGFYTGGDYLADGPRRIETVGATRPLIELLLRQRVTALDGVDIRPNTQFVDYRSTPDQTRVEGVLVRREGDETTLDASLVVDATGRTSRTPEWLDTHGYAPPDLEEVSVDLAYSTTYLERPDRDHRTYIVPPDPPRTRGGMAAPVEDNRWVVNVNGLHGDHPPTETEELVSFLESLPVPELAALAADHDWTGDVDYYPFPSSRRYRYESLDRFPDGLVVLGDAIASYNPLYGQGMSVAALEALALHHALAAAGDPESLAPRYFDRATAVADVAWRLAVGNDFGFEATTGPRPTGTALVGRYLSRLVDRAHTDPVVAAAFVRVMTLEEPPSRLFRPGVLRRVLGPRR
ncbi:FAD-dependent oxidoreductase [Haloarcula onubensis]|uniref:FAD-dependent monooxygenase n=1 Tax=Haloarcula onubensis TaxID=2950539 RepID=A0ABU2FLI2_9EURY|nr:FAD-dependent monooxygenase [Halomicroarcula sp. S3CR25-11]MDS0281626.1 FAD-dependent monooxygenase [Halomicroarcula sp. S3CR25-11]